MIRSERGEFSLIGLLVTMVILGFILMATYEAFDVFNRNVKDNQTRTEATDRARTASDRIARELRNMATPTPLQPNAVAQASDYDVVFETVAPTGTPPTANPQNVEFVRYCLDSSTRRLWYGELSPGSVTSSTVAPTGGGCPGAGWSNTRVIAGDIVNVYGSSSRPMFKYDSTTLNAIRRVSIDLFVDTTPGTGSAEQEVSTSIDLRNQDRPPVAGRFVPSLAGGGIVVLDGTASSDPDNDPLTYCWYDSSASGTVGTCNTGSVSDAQYFRYRTTAGTQHTITLTVTDPSGLTSSYTAPTFTST